MLTMVRNYSQNHQAKSHDNPLTEANPSLLAVTPVNE